MTVKRTPHHSLSGIKAAFVDADSLVITATALAGARALGYSLAAVVEVVQALEQGDFDKSETAHSPPNHRVWHDTYIFPAEDHWLYLKFAGETLVDVTLTSFKEAHYD
jgi:motility quorum-sensing regulator / GCU-specific mRNA interferase toxin